MEPAIFTDLARALGVDMKSVIVGASLGIIAGERQLVKLLDLTNSNLHANEDLKAYAFRKKLGVAYHLLKKLK